MQIFSQRLSLRLLTFLCSWVAGTSFALAQANFPAPRLLDTHIKRYVVGLRPGRVGGINLQPQELRLEDSSVKFVISHYGHGGAGLTLAPATAAEAVSILAHSDRRTEASVAVLGSGVVGMMTAKKLLEAGKHVRLYASQNVRTVDPNDLSDYASLVAGGLFAPVSVDETTERPGRFGDWVAQAYLEYLEYGQVNARSGIRPMPVFATGFEADDLRRVLRPLYEGRITAFPRDYDRMPIGGSQVSGTRFETLRIDTPVFVRNLHEVIESLGGEFVLLHLESQQDLQKIPESVIFNCLGLGARKVFNDSQVYPIAGQLVFYQPDTRVQHMFIGDHIDVPNIDPQIERRARFSVNYMFPRRQEIVVGGTFEPHVTDTTPRLKDCALMARELRLAHGISNH